MGLLTLPTATLAVNSENVPVPHASLHVYYAGGENYAPAYADAHLTVMQSNPIQANEAGHFPACHLVDGAYRIVVLDPKDGMLFSQDNVAVLTDPSTSAATAASGASEATGSAAAAAASAQTAASSMTAAIASEAAAGVSASAAAASAATAAQHSTASASNASQAVQSAAAALASADAASTNLTAAAASAAEAATQANAATSAALAAGASLFDSVSALEAATTSGDYGLIALQSGTRLYENVGGTATPRGWLQTPSFSSVSGMLASTATDFVDGDTIVANQFHYKVADLAATDHHLTTAGGVKLYAQPTAAGHYNFDCMAPAGDGITDDYPKLQILLDSAPHGSGFYQSTTPIYFPPGDYRMNSTIELKRSTKLFGDSSGMPSDSMARLIFPADTTGIIVHRYNTIADGVEIPPSTGGDASTIEGLRLKSTRGSDKTKHGIWLRARATLRNLNIEGFSGNGVHIVASSGGGTHLEGNANNWIADTIRIIQCGGNGWYVDGADVNAGVASYLDVSTNARSGVWDSSFLGNTYLGCHCASNGVANAAGNGANESAFVTDGTNRYVAHPDATDSELVTVAPGTDDSVWIQQETGGVHPQIPLWLSGQTEGTYFRAFSFHTDNNNARNLVLGLYTESGAPGVVLDGPCLALGGSISYIIRGNNLQRNSQGNLTASSWASSAGALTTYMGGDAANGDILKWSHDDDTASWPWRLRRSGPDWAIDNANGAAGRQAMIIHGENTTRTMGTSSPQPYIASFPVFGVGSGGTARRQTTASAAPASGTWARGDIVWNVLPAPGGSAGWICTTSGTGGSAVFKTFGAIEA